jgi:hypothetical protein
MFEKKFDLKLLIRDLFTAIFVLLLLSFVLEQEFRGIIITVISLNYLLVATIAVGVSYIILINKN